MNFVKHLKKLRPLKKFPGFRGQTFSGPLKIDFRINTFVRYAGILEKNQNLISEYLVMKN